MGRLRIAGDHIRLCNQVIFETESGVAPEGGPLQIFGAVSGELIAARTLVSLGSLTVTAGSDIIENVVTDIISETRPSRIVGLASPNLGSVHFNHRRADAHKDVFIWGEDLEHTAAA